MRALWISGTTGERLDLEQIEAHIAICGGRFVRNEDGTIKTTETGWIVAVEHSQDAEDVIDILRTRYLMRVQG